jgi:phenylalanyl-tRNA synthetase beta chain
MLAAISRNQKKRNLDLALFETGAVFIDNGPGVLPEEHHRLCCAMTGRRFPQTWAWPDREVDFFDIKGLVKNMLDHMNITGTLFRVSTNPESFYIPGTCVEVISAEGILMGTIGQIDKRVYTLFDIPSQVFLADFAVPALIKASTTEKQFRPLARFPAIDLDLSIILDDYVRFQDVFSFIQEKRADLLESVSIFDVYRGKPVPRGKKSLAFRFIYRSEDRTLSEPEVLAVHEPLVNSLLQEFHAEMRS